ncbi:NADPH2 dehydrogenase [Bacillus ectoiniformans]|uniref:NADPH dehydrogenase NamA n=1 Tax=Bacillus ectoiniformans TaxID=1494429 RepID=UPI00195E29FB|nr:NADPH dehydrogenase NamA [Bacillus ectoiniformans]MBM7648091.1 NADPH2 dehydrogenase [Bacillus ectoiniformans]
MSAKLFESYTIKDVTLKNRIVMSPMCMYSAENDGKVTDWHLVHYPTRAVGQAGLIMVEATAVTPQGRISENDLGVWNDEHIEGLAKVVSMVKAHGAKTAIQLAHAGRKSMVTGDIIAPSAIAFDEKMKTPLEMTADDIAQTIQAFKDGACRVKEAGFDIVEIHGAHGYLINEFLSPLTNKREDEYGGSKENRYRFLKEVIEAVQSEWNGPLFVRVSANDYADGGLDAEDYSEIASWMKEQGVDLIDVSSGAVVPARIPIFPGYQVKFAETIRQGADMPVGAVGLITSGLQAEEILQNNRADLIFLGRELLRDPYWPRQAARDLRVEIEAPEQYKRGWN